MAQATPVKGVSADLIDTESPGFPDLDLDSRLLRAIAKLGFAHPTVVQSTTITLALQGKDILARARTGSGKTAAYSIPVIQKILLSKEAGRSSSGPGVRGLILVPTRELAEQVLQHIKDLTIYCSKEVTAVNLATSDQSLTNQKAILAEKPDIVVATPSRILAQIQAGTVILKESLESLVIDEADLILSYGYDEDVRSVLTHLPKIYQSYLMSATMSSDVDQLKQLVLRNPAILKLTEASTAPESTLTQYFVNCSDSDKFLLTYFMLKLKIHPFGTGKCIIFVNDIDRCYKLKLFLEQFGIKCCTLNSGLPPRSRYHIVQEFNRGVYDYIIATDEAGMLSEDRDSDDEEGDEQEGEAVAAKVSVADGEEKDDEEKVEEEEEPATKAGNKRSAKEVAPSSTSTKRKKAKSGPKDAEYGVSRGIDFQNVQAVINFDLPTSSRSYQHRVGRTARGVGSKGWALSFIVPDDAPIPHDAPRKKTKRTQVQPFKRPITDTKVFARIQKRQVAMGRELNPFEFDMKQVSGFKYRADDALRAVTRVAIKEARMKELKMEILNSEKLKAHFEDNPTDLHALRHDKPLHPTRVQQHMKHVPDYLLPNRNGTTSNTKVSHVPFRMNNRRRTRGGGAARGGRGGAAGQGRKKDPLKSFKYSSAQ
ncbi:P-loop containing nucleoside triphosphate hydrolase protein [Phlyctochytrium arcticum]|nr:P-loop containing nucleoside triphosphate hydrolase protein [Phlyctochytrium arcticum]